MPAMCEPLGLVPIEPCGGGELILSPSALSKLDFFFWGQHPQEMSLIRLSWAWPCLELFSDACRSEEAQLSDRRQGG